MEARLYLDHVEVWYGQRTEYLKILKLAADQGEVQVDGTLRSLLEGTTEARITAEAIDELLVKLDSIAPVTMVEVAAVDLSGLDLLLPGWRCGNERGG